jgi:DNA-binding IclR family transcriptional regulator
MNKYKVPALEKAIAILDLLANSDKGFSITEFHTMLNIPKATVFTTLSVLEEYQIVKKDDKGKFQIGPKLYFFGMRYTKNNNLIDISRPHLIKLMEETRFTVYLGILEEGKVLYVDKHEPDSFIKFTSYPGMRSEIHITGIGKAIAAFLPENELELMLRKDLKKYTEKTITTLEAFKKSLNTVRTNGYAVEDEEEQVGVRCIGAPIFNSRDKVIAAISVATLTSQLPMERSAEIGKKIQETAMKISKDCS